MGVIDLMARSTNFVTCVSPYMHCTTRRHQTQISSIARVFIPLRIVFPSPGLMFHDSVDSHSSAKKKWSPQNTFRVRFKPFIRALSVLYLRNVEKCSKREVVDSAMLKEGDTYLEWQKMAKWRTQITLSLRQADRICNLPARNGFY